MSDADLSAQLIALEKGFWSAAGDPGFYGDHFADDGMIVLAMATMDKSAVMRSMESARPWEDYRLHDPHLVEISDDVAALTYRATARRQGDPTDYTPYVSSIYVRRDGAWRLIVHQQTPAA